MANTAAKKLTYDSKPVQVESAIRDGTGKEIATTYQKKPQVIQYTVPTSVTAGNKVIAEYNGTYDGSPGYVKFVMEVTSSSYKGIYTIEASWGQANGGITLVSSNGATGDAVQATIYYPSSTSNYAYPPLLAIYNMSTREKQVKITVLEDSGNLTWKTDWNTTASTTGRSTSNINLSYTSHVNYAGSATSASYSTNSNQSYATKAGRFRTGETDTYRIMAVDSTGVAYKINTSSKKFPLPISMYIGAGLSANQTIVDTYVQVGGNTTSYTSVSYLSSSSYNNFTLPTLTASDGGKTLYIRGSLDSDGYFVCDGHVTLSMEAGYTYIPFGTLNPYYSGSTAQVPTTYSFNAISVPAFTLDANGKLTHIDGKELAGGGGTYTLSSVSATFSLQGTPDYSEFPYCAEVSAPGVTPNSYASVTYSNEQSQSLIYSPTAVTDTGKVKIYARQNVGTVTIPTIAIGIESPVTDDAQPISAPIETRTLTLVSSSDSEYSGFPYKYSFACVGATATRTAEVTFDTSDATSGNFAPVCETGDGVIYIWARSSQASAKIGYMLYYVDTVAVTGAVDLSSNQTVGGNKTFTGQLIASGQRAYSSSNTTDVVTIGSLQSSTDVVHRTGNEDVSGFKTFKNNPLTDSANGEAMYWTKQLNANIDTVPSGWNCWGRYFHQVANGQWLGGLEMVQEGSARYLQLCLNTSRTQGTDSWSGNIRLHSISAGQYGCSIPKIDSTLVWSGSTSITGTGQLLTCNQDIQNNNFTFLVFVFNYGGDYPIFIYPISSKWNGGQPFTFLVTEATFQTKIRISPYSNTQFSIAVGSGIEGFLLKEVYGI